SSEGTIFDRSTSSGTLIRWPCGGGTGAVMWSGASPAPVQESVHGPSAGSTHQQAVASATPSGSSQRSGRSRGHVPAFSDSSRTVIEDAPTAVPFPDRLA